MPVSLRRHSSEFGPVGSTVRGDIVAFALFGALAGRCGVFPHGVNLSVNGVRCSLCHNAFYGS